MRALDVNPFSDTGISIEQVHFLDIFLTFCAFIDNEEFECSAQKVHESNMDEVVLRGRDPELLLSDTNMDGDVELKSISTWGNELFSQMEQVAKLLDNAYGTTHYADAIIREQAKINNPDLTPSAEILSIIKQQCLSQFALDKAAQYQEQAKTRHYQFYNQAFFDDSVQISHQDQADIEANDKLNFDDFLSDYFA